MKDIGAQEHLFLCVFFTILKNFILYFVKTLDFPAFM